MSLITPERGFLGLGLGVVRPEARRCHPVDRAVILHVVGRKRQGLALGGGKDEKEDCPEAKKGHGGMVTTPLKMD